MYFLIFLQNFKYWNNTISAKSENDAKTECRMSVQKDVTRMTLDALGECVFGYKFNTIEEDDTIISRAVTDVLTGIDGSANTFTRKVVQRFPFLKYFVKSFIKRQEALTIIQEVIKQVQYELPVFHFLKFDPIISPPL
jgi:hypothetical protein